MSNNAICSACGAPIPPDAQPGLCSKCLFLLGLQDASATESTETEIGDSVLEATQAETSASAQSRIANQKSPIGRVRYFGDYELLEEIARGGMGIVFRARQVSLNRMVALKLISSGALATEDLVKRFKAEAEAAASLSHPNIVPIYEIGEHEGQHYFSMGLIEGPDLRKAIANSRMSILNFQLPPSTRADVEIAVALLAKIARAVHYAHQRGVLHRDLKPSNILLDLQGEPHLTDFGLAKLIQKDSTLTHTHAVLGTPAYMAPEQARGETKDVTTAADVYGLGAILYETLTGSPPFAGGTTVETIRQVLEQEPRHPSIFNRSIDRDLETICLKCLDKDPQRRYGSPEALAEDLNRWLRHEPILARQSSDWERFLKRIKRRPAIAALIGLLVVSIAVGEGTAFWQWRNAVNAREDTMRKDLDVHRMTRVVIALGRDKELRLLLRNHPNLINLSSYYNATPMEAWLFTKGTNEHGPKPNLVDLPSGIQTFAGVSFAVFNIIQLSGQRIEAEFPEKIEAIRIGRKARRLHFLHATGWVIPDGTRVGSYVLHYVDGGQREIPIVYGEDLRGFHAASPATFVDGALGWRTVPVNWQQPIDNKTVIKNGTIAWQSESPWRGRLFTSAWTNSLPDVEITSLDFISAMTDCFPFLIAITVE